ncbi:MAG: GNAT family N-acetyltransferase [Bacteroidales bacterium]|nr:GNAT family N-acetyltransferase [Bacteroidales bacterium]
MMQITTLKQEELPIFVNLYMKFINYLRYDCNEFNFTYDENITKKLLNYFEEKLTDPYHIIYIAREENEIQGFIAGDIRPGFFTFTSLGLNGYISSIYVEECNRMKSVSKILEAYIINNFFKKHKVQYVELHCLINNTRAKKLWQTLGYENFREQLRKKIC